MAKDEIIKPKATRARKAVKLANKSADKITKPVVKKPRVPRKKVAAPIAAETAVSAELKIGKPTISGGRYIFATGRRKTAVANVRLFSGHGGSVINKKAVEKYFIPPFLQETVMQPFQLTGLAKDFYFTAHINGGGIHAQAQALRHGLAQALGQLNDDLRKILKKNSLLTRDDRKKERKKPGLKRARRSPQWAKR